MQERQVTSEDGTRKLERPFLVLATQNPIEYEGTYPLPEAQLDRFLLRISVGYPDRAAELELLARRMERGRDEVELEQVVDRDELLAMQRAVELVHADDGILGYAVDLVTATRESPQVQVGASPRGTLALLKLSRARAALEGRDFVTPDDVKVVAVPALAHRITLRPELWIQRVQAEDVVRDCLERCPAPPVRVAVTRAASPRLRVYIGARGGGAHGGPRHGTPGARGARHAVRAARRRGAGRPGRSRSTASCGSNATARSKARRCARRSPITNRGGGARVDVHLPAAARLDSDTTPIGFWLAARRAT